MERFYYFILIIPIAFLFHYIRFKLTRWEEIVEHYESNRRPELNPVYGFSSEFRRSSNSYPLSNTFLKIAVTPFGLYLQYDLKYEPIKYYKPVMVPWGDIRIADTEKARNKGFREIILSKDEVDIGAIFLQIHIIEKIMDEAKKLGIRLNFV